MKLFILTLLLPSLLLATEFKFKYKDGSESLQIKVTEKSWESAYKFAAKQCFHYFMKKEAKFNEERGLDIIDICANPR